MKRLACNGGGGEVGPVCEPTSPQGETMLNSNFWKWFARISAIIGLITGSIAFYNYVTTDEYTIEQSVDPETMKRLKELGPGEKIIVEKGRPSDDT